MDGCKVRVPLCSEGPVFAAAAVLGGSPASVHTSGASPPQLFVDGQAGLPVSPARGCCSPLQCSSSQGCSLSSGPASRGDGKPKPQSPSCACSLVHETGDSFLLAFPPWPWHPKIDPALLRLSTLLSSMPRGEKLHS